MTRDRVKRCVVAIGVSIAALTFTLDGSSLVSDVAQASVEQSSAEPASGAGGWVAGVWSQPINSEATSPRVDQPQTGAPANQPDDKPVEQTHKNIQVLKGLPDSQLLPMMQLFAASLGVRCESCHVRNPSGQWEFDKDDKKMKQTARKMIQMTQDINKTSFEGKTEVTCYACHHGSEHPVNAPILPVALERPAARSNEPWPTPQQILARYVEAVGGKDAAGKIQSRSIKGSFVAADGSSVPMELSYQSPNKLVSVIVTRQGPITQAMNGASGWTKTPRETRVLNPVELDRVKSLAGSLEPLQLKEPYPRLVFAGKEKIGDREANMLRMVTADRKRVTWYFDTQTGLLLRRLVLRETIVGPDPEQTDYEDYRDVEGVKLPFSIRISYPGPNLSGTRKVVEVKTNEAIDATKFAMPK